MSRGSGQNDNSKALDQLIDKDSFESLKQRVASLEKGATETNARVKNAENEIEALKRMI